MAEQTAAQKAEQEARAKAKADAEAESTKPGQYLVNGVLVDANGTAVKKQAA